MPRVAASIVALALASACAPKQAGESEAPAVVVVPESAAPTDQSDLIILRHRAAMGQVREVRATIEPRLSQATKTAPDAGRDALRRLSIEMALSQGDSRRAERELQILEDDIGRLGAAARPEDQAILALLHGDLAYRAGRFLDARKWSLRAMALLDGSGSPLFASALRGLARDLLALGNLDQALGAIDEAIVAHARDADAEERELHEDLLLKAEVLLALRMHDEAVITAHAAYNGAIERFGPDSLPHAEALLVVAAATYASGSADSAGSMVADVREIYGALQAAAADPSFPVSERLALRLDQLSGLVPTPADE